MKKKIIIIVSVVILLAIGAAVYFANAGKKDTIDSGMLSAKLENVAELSTQKLTYSGYHYYEKGKVRFLDKKSFYMFYTAEMKAGIKDLSKMKVDVTEDIVTVTLPHAELLSIEVDENSIRFVKKDWSLINPTNEEDVLKAIAESKALAKQNANYPQLIENAEVNAKAIITAILSGTVGEREIVVVFE